MKNKYCSNKSLWIIIPAGGHGSRMESVLPKQYLPLNDYLGGNCVLQCTMNSLQNIHSDKQILIGIASDDDYFQTHINTNEATPSWQIFEAGKERVDTVLAGLKAIINSPNYQPQLQHWVLVHDAARPCVSSQDIDRLIRHCLGQTEHNDIAGTILAKPLVDTIKKRSSAESNVITETIDRQNLLAALTPQMFKLDVLLSALETCKAKQLDSQVTDESSAIEMMDLTVEYVLAQDENPKITYPSDLDYAQWLLDQRQKII